MLEGCRNVLGRTMNLAQAAKKAGDKKYEDTKFALYRGNVFVCSTN